jgi:NAD(P)H-hydrate repair Nnr-like enzyme with NAD(P)H-hydrate epimerase domain
MGFEQQSISRWLAMASVKPKRSVFKEVQSKAKSGTCLICGKPAKGSRGLCVAHYLQFSRTLRELSKGKRAAFEQEQIEAGRILASGAIRDIKAPNPFATEGEEQ